MAENLNTSSKLLKIVIVTDNYKLPFFREKLAEADYLFEEMTFDYKTTAIFIFAPSYAEIKKICEQVERQCKAK